MEEVTLAVEAAVVDVGDDFMKAYALMLILPLILLIGIGNLTPKNYISITNITDTYRTYIPQKAAGLETAYEYVVNNSRNSSLVVRIANYQNYTDALNVYIYLYAAKLQNATTRIPHSELNQEFNFSNIESLENYIAFSDLNQTSLLNYSTLYMVISNSVVEYYSIGLQTNPLTASPSSAKDLAAVANQTAILPTTTVAAIQVGTSYNTLYTLVAAVIICLIIAAAYEFNRRRVKSPPQPPLDLTGGTQNNSSGP